MKKAIKLILAIASIACIIFSIPEFSYQNQGRSTARGSTGRGSLENAYILPYYGANFQYFSPLSYFLLDNAYLHSKTHKIVLEAYKECEKTCEGTEFRIMECTRKEGGEMLIHRSHQNGLSVDFMIPKKRGEEQSLLYDRSGMLHYLLEFDDSGRLWFDKEVKLDLETAARHILGLDNAAKRNGMRIKRVILKTDLKAKFYQTESGKKVKARGIYLVRSLPDLVNRVHDDHYHVDFAFVQ